MKPSPEIRIMGALAAIALVALGVDLTFGEVRAVDPTVPGPRFVEVSRFCGPPSGAESTGMAAALADERLPISMVPGGDPTEVPSRHTIARQGSDVTTIVGYGGEVAAGTIARFGTPVEGWGAARCSGLASDHWYFAEGSSLLGYAEQLVLFNPFPDEAVVGITLHTPTGEDFRAGLSDIAVPAGETVEVPLNEFIEQEASFGMSVQAARGRVVAWRFLSANPGDRPSGVQSTLGATSPALGWYFAQGVIQDGVDEVISIANPSSREALVTITLVSGRQNLQVPRLVEQQIPPGALKTFSLQEAMGGSDTRAGSVSAIVRTLNDVPVVAERTVWYGTLGAQGTASEVGAARAAERWAVPPASVAASDDSVSLLNPGRRAATVTITLLRSDGRPLTPGPLANIRLRGGRSTSVDIQGYTHGRPMFALVEATEPVVAERWAYSATGSDVSTVLGTPLGAQS